MAYHILKDNGPRPINLLTGPDWQLYDAGAGWGILFSTGPEWQVSDIGTGWQLHDGGPGWGSMKLDDGPGWDELLTTGPNWSQFGPPEGNGEATLHLDFGERGATLIVRDGGERPLPLTLSPGEQDMPHFLLNGPGENDQPILLSDNGPRWVGTYEPNLKLFVPPEGGGSPSFGPGEGNIPVLH